MNFLPFVSLSFLEREGKSGLPCLHRLIPLHEATGSSHYHCPYAQTQHLSSAQEDTGRVAASSSGLSPHLLLTTSLCMLPGQGDGEEKEEGGMVHTASNKDWSENPADGGKSGRSSHHQPPYLWAVSGAVSWVCDGVRATGRLAVRFRDHLRRLHLGRSHHRVI